MRSEHLILSLGVPREETLPLSWKRKKEMTRKKKGKSLPEGNEPDTVEDDERSQRIGE